MRDFNLVGGLEQMAEDDPLSVIPKDIPREKLFEALKPILEYLVSEAELTQESCLKRIEGHCSLTEAEAKALRKDFKSLCKGQKKPQEADKVTPIALHPDIVEIIEHQEQPAFLTTNAEITTQLTIEGQTYCPPKRDALPFLLPRAEAVAEALDENDRQLYQDIRDYIYSASDLPGAAWYDLLTAWVLHTYLIERFEYSPYIWFYAVPERGKSRTGKALIYLAYRGFYTESLRDAYLVRIAHTLGASLFLDVAEIWKKAEKYGTEDILLNRYERGNKVPRVLHPDKGPFKDTVYFSIFGPTLIATNETVPTALDSRAIQINMPPPTRNFKNKITPQLALPLKERLIAFRYRHMATIMPDDIEQPSLGRLGDILEPLAQIIRLVQPDRMPAFMGLVREIEERRGIDRGETTEAKLVKAIVDLEDAVEYGRLAIKRISDKFNEGTPEKYQSRPETISRKLVALGFVRVRVHGGKRCIVYDEILVKKLALTYLENASPASPLAKCTNHADFKGDTYGDANDSIQKPSPEPSPRKANNGAGFGSGDGSDTKTQGVSERKNTPDGCGYYQTTKDCRAAREIELMTFEHLVDDEPFEILEEVVTDALRSADLFDR